MTAWIDIWQLACRAGPFSVGSQVPPEHQILPERSSPTADMKAQVSIGIA